jgi:hypothetical protein
MQTTLYFDLSETRRLQNCQRVAALEMQYHCGFANTAIACGFKRVVKTHDAIAASHAGLPSMPRHS